MESHAYKRFVTLCDMVSLRYIYTPTAQTDRWRFTEDGKASRR